MRTLTFAAVLMTTTAVSVAFHRPTSGEAETSRASSPEVDLAAAALAKADGLAKADPKRAAAFYRACLALEGAGGEPATFRAARERLKAMEAPAPQPRKGAVTALAAKVVPGPEAVPVKADAPRVTAISVGPDGVVYDERP
ncbi:MAG: hypothetical protein ACRC33_20645 [Gemmataceae bacterium]